MAATASYTITYTLSGVQPADVNIYYQGNSDPSPILDTTILGVPSGVPQTYTFSNLPSHRVYRAIVESYCNGVSQFGDIAYLMNLVCNEPIAVENGAAIDVTWDSYVTPNGDSVKEYRIEYRIQGSGDPYTIVTIPIGDIVSYWSNNPGTFPSYTATLTSGISIGETYEINFYTILNYNYATVNGDIVAEIEIGPCSITPPVSLSNFEELENGNIGQLENDNLSILEN